MPDNYDDRGMGRFNDAFERDYGKLNKGEMSDPPWLFYIALLAVFIAGFLVLFVATDSRPPMWELPPLLFDK